MRPESTCTPAPVGSTTAGTDRRWQEARRRVLGVHAGLDGVAAERDPFWVTGNFSPAAMRTCHSTRSQPVTISVTGCSTCSRVFISMKKNSVGPVGGDDELMVPAPT